MENIMQKTTLATIKKFIRINKGKLFISNKNSFNGMTDGIDPCHDKSFRPVQDSKPTIHKDHKLGIEGAWFVFGSRDYFEKYQDDEFVGYEISNCCGNFILATKFKVAQ